MNNYCANTPFLIYSNVLLSIWKRSHKYTHIYTYIYIIEVFVLLCAKSINGIFNDYYI